MIFMYDGPFPPEIGSGESIVINDSITRVCGSYDSCDSPNRSETNCIGGTGFHILYSLTCGGPAQLKPRTDTNIKLKATNPRIWIVEDQNPGGRL